MRRPVLILGASEDPHVQQVKTQITSLGAETWVLDPRAGDWSVSASPGVEGLEFWDASGDSFSPVGIWNRLKPVSAIGVSEAAAFTLRERTDFLIGIADGFYDATINSPSSQAKASVKLTQLRLAKSVGLEVPRTGVSNNPEYIVNAARESPIIYKPLTWLATSHGEILFSKLASQKELVHARDALAVAPGIYQEYINKSRELRVTILDDEFFCVAIYSQRLEETRIDWRRNQRDIDYELIPVPSVLRSKLHDLMKTLGLRYGAIDVIERPDGEFVFLEINPSGNWLWLEDRLGIDISGLMARKLLGQA